MSTKIQYDPIPFDETYILYDPGDIVSMVSVQFSLLPIYIMVFYTAWFILTREIEPVIIVAGHLAGNIANKIVKMVVKQPRPDFHKDFGAGSSSLGFGMPSAHSQFMGLMAAYYSFTLMYRVESLGPREKKFGVFCLVTMCVGVAFSRVYLFYHTIPQVVAGVFIGSFLGTCYFVVVSVARDVGLVDWVLNWPLVKFFYVKDSYYHCYTSFKDEYSMYLHRRQQASSDKEKIASKKLE